jgi:hypothetical protein
MPIMCGGFDQPVPTFLRKFVGSGTDERDAARDRYGIPGVLVDEAKLKFRIKLDEFGVILVVSPRIIQISKMTPGSLLNGARGLAQVGRVREGAYGQGGRPVLVYDGVQKCRFYSNSPEIAPKDLTLIKRKKASSNRIAEIIVNEAKVMFVHGAIKSSEYNDNVENFKRNVAYNTLAVTG